MQLTDERRALLSTSARQLADALALITTEARQRLAGAVDVDPGNVLVTPGRSMAGGASRAAESIRVSVAKDRDSLQRLAREPFIAKLNVVGDDGHETTLYISRGGVSALPSLPGIRLVSYGAPLGRLAEYSPGSVCRVPGSGGSARSGVVAERVRLVPTLSGGTWDAKDASFEWEDWKVVLASLAQLLDQDSDRRDTDSHAPDVIGDLLRQHLDSQLLRATARRQHLESMSLRDQPILDIEQGNIFRMPLQRKVWLIGPPGTGKTTTLIRRLSHKRTAEDLSEDEVDLLKQHGLVDAFFGADGWVMFAPTDLLKLYLQDAFNRESVPATSDNLKTWAKHRVHLGRNVLGILRSGERPGLQLAADASILARSDSTVGVALYERFSAYHFDQFSAQLEKSFDTIRTAGSADLWERVSRLQPPEASRAPLSEKLAGIVDNREAVLPRLKALDEQVETQIREVTNRLIRHHPTLLKELETALTEWMDDAGDDASEDDEDESDSSVDAPASIQRPTAGAAALYLLRAIRSYAAALARGRSTVSGRSGKILALVGSRVPGRDVLAPIGQVLTLRQALRSVTQSPRRFVMSVPKVYGRFRRESSADLSLYGPSADTASKAGRISGPELDVLILLMLRHARLVMQPRGIRTTLRPSSQDEDWMETIRAEYVCQVFVDEATDFSATQLGCLMELAHPALRSWFACGDFMQRINAEGVSTQSEVDWLATLDGEGVEVESLSRGYRQSDKLRRLVQSFATAVSSTAPTILPPEFEHPDAVAPLLREHAADDELAQWLADRIAEIESRLGVLPSIAIFVDGDERIDPLVALLEPLLGARNVNIVGCKQGRVVGEEQEVRVFDVRYIKGLEFEAVFFVGVDRLAESLGALFAQLFLVGASRAASYLAITSEGDLPTVISSVREHFSDGTWQ
jgi:hypothetical protein